MDTHVPETLEYESKSVNSVDFRKTLDGSSPISLPSSENSTDADKFSDDSIEEERKSDNEREAEEGLEEVDLDSSYVGNLSSYSYSHWAEPWRNLTDSKSLESQSTVTEAAEVGLPSDSPEWLSETKVEAKPLVSVPSRWNPYGDDEDIISLSDIHVENKPFMLGAGLANLGNTCFLNAVMQSFMHTVPLIQGLRCNDHVTPCDSFLKGFCVICALRELIDISLASKDGVVSPWKFVDSLNYFSSTFHRFQQEDAHEFLQCFLDRLETCYDESRPKDREPSETDNIVKQAFGGRLVSKLLCCNCGHCSDTYEPIIDLSLEIEDVDSLTTALESFTKVEKIEDSDIKFTCGTCKEQVSIEKQLVLDKAPSVAALHLKRFKNDGSVVEKIDKYVSFPLELDLHTYAERNLTDNEEMKYDLYAVIVHIGFSYCSGHYYSFIRSAPDEWYQFDDSKVVRVREDYVLSQEAYILFYAKRGTPWYSDFIETQNAFTDPSMMNASPKSVLDHVDAVCPTSLCAPNCVKESNDVGDEASPCAPNTLASCIEESNDVAGEASPKSRLGKDQDNEGKVNAHMMSTPGPLSASAFLDPDSQVDNVSLASTFKENIHTQSTRATKGNLNNTPKTPSRSPSPEIYREDPPETDYYIPRDHLMLSDKDSCKKQLQKELEHDMETKQACTLIKKNMPGSRAQQLLAAVRGSRSEGSTNKRRRRMEVSPSRDDRRSSGRRRSSIGSGLQTVMAGSLR